MTPSTSPLSGVELEERKPNVRSLYSPEKGMIACVLLQAAFGGDRRPCNHFGAGDWETGMPDKTFGWVEMPMEAWRRLGRMTRDERIAAASLRVDDRVGL